MNVVNSSVADIVCIIPSKDDDETITQSVESALASSVAVDVLIIDDGSKRPVSQVLEDCACERLHILRIERSIGITRALNVGVEWALERDYGYIGRLDGDDWCYPKRFERQLAFLRDNPQVGIVGTSVDVSSESGQIVGHFDVPSSEAAIHRALWDNSAFVHPTLLIRREVFETGGGYDECCKVSQDYELVRRTALKFRLANLPERLVAYRVRSKSLSATKRRLQLWTRLRVQWRYRSITAFAFYKGVARTMALLLMPSGLIDWLKGVLARVGGETIVWEQPK